MRYLSVFIASFCLVAHSFAQPRLMANDTAKVYYSKTDFNFVDSLSFWSFSVNKEVAYNPEDSLTPAYELTFSRKKPINNYYTNYSTKIWQTTITYKVYRLRDSTYCFEKSNQIRRHTNFVPPYAGGDYFIIGKFIFLNTNECLGCIQYRTGIDYCRPVINALISALDPTKPYSIEGIVRQFPIKRVEVAEEPKQKNKPKSRPDKFNQIF